MNSSLGKNLNQFSESSGLRMDEIIDRLNLSTTFKLQCVNIFNQKGLEYEINLIDNCVEKMIAADDIYGNLINKIHK
jgi:hypothetical protein